MNQKNSIFLQAQGIKDEIIRNRRWFHTNPELGFAEIRTAAYIENYLTELGLEVRTGIAKTGIAAVLKGGLPGNTVALRSDIDALPLTEETGLDFKSGTDGRMHACGHDTHMAMLLGAARLLAENRSLLRGTVKFIFQPAEEYVSGAKVMIDEGVLENPDVDIALALHIVPHIASGRIEVKDGVITASMDEFEITILGRGGHGSNPQSTIDPIATGAQLVTALQTIVSRKIHPLQPAVVSVGQFVAGTKSNIIPQTAYLSGTIRCFDPAVRKKIQQEMRRITKGICSAAGAGFQLKINTQVPVSVNNAKLCRDFVRCTTEILDPNEIHIMEKPETFSEDFALFANKVPSLLFFLGTENEQKGCVHPLHSANFMVDEDILPLGASLLANYCLSRRI